MSRIVIQAGHCHRKRDSVGTQTRDGSYTEQQFTWAVANRAVALLRDDGHAALVIEADVPNHAYRGNAFVAIHADGNNSPNVYGASVGYRTNEGKALAHAWKAAYKALGWSGGFRGDNYTAALGGYYGTKRAVAEGNRRACILEFGFLTNPGEAAQLRSKAGQERAAQSVRRAVNASLGISTPDPTTEGDDMTPEQDKRLHDAYNGVNLLIQAVRNLSERVDRLYEERTIPASTQRQNVRNVKRIGTKVGSEVEGLDEA